MPHGRCADVWWPARSAVETVGHDPPIVVESLEPPDEVEIDRPVMVGPDDLWHQVRVATIVAVDLERVGDSTSGNRRQPPLTLGDVASECVERLEL